MYYANGKVYSTQWKSYLFF